MLQGATDLFCDQCYILNAVSTIVIDVVWGPWAVMSLEPTPHRRVLMAVNMYGITISFHVIIL